MLGPFALGNPSGLSHISGSNSPINQNRNLGFRVCNSRFSAVRVLLRRVLVVITLAQCEVRQGELRSFYRVVVDYNGVTSYSIASLFYSLLRSNSITFEFYTIARGDINSDKMST